MEGEVQRKVFSHYDIGTNPRTIEDLCHTIQQLKYLDETCSWKFKERIDNLERRLEDLLEKKDKESRTVEIIKKYDIASKKVKRKKILVKSAEIKDKIVPMIPLIEEHCLMLSFDMERYQFNKTIQEIKSLCTTSECDHAFLTDLQEQWEREDKNRRTIQGIEYETREEASEAGVELKKIEKLYEGYKKSYTQKYLSLMKCSFKTKSAKQKIQQKEKELIDNAKIKARDIFLNAKEDANSIIKQMNEIKNSNVNIKDLENLRNKLNTKIKNSSLTKDTANFSSNSVEKLNVEDLKPNTEVFVKTLGQNGIIVSHISKSNEVQVKVGIIKMNVHINNIEKAHVDKTKKSDKQIQTSGYTSISKSKTVKSEINVIGLNVEEAVFVVDKFLDDCCLAKLQTVRIVHGKGTGKLKTGIHNFLKTNPHVKSYRMGTYGEGEMGVTVVTLK